MKEHKIQFIKPRRKVGEAQEQGSTCTKERKVQFTKPKRKAGEAKELGSTCTKERKEQLEHKRQSEEPPEPPSAREIFSLASLEEPVNLPTKEGWDSSVPITLTYASQGTHRLLRLRTKGDELAAQAKPREQTPTARAILLANALKIEAILMTGEFKNASELARAIGVSKKHLSTMLGMLNMGVEEMERVLMETR